MSGTRIVWHAAGFREVSKSEEMQRALGDFARHYAAVANGRRRITAASYSAYVNVATHTALGIVAHANEKGAIDAAIYHTLDNVF